MTPQYFIKLRQQLADASRAADQFTSFRDILANMVGVDMETFNAADVTDQALMIVRGIEQFHKLHVCHCGRKVTDHLCPDRPKYRPEIRGTETTTVAAHDDAARGTR